MDSLFKVYKSPFHNKIFITNFRHISGILASIEIHVHDKNKIVIDRLLTLFQRFIQ